jgi:hypothetical protein
MTTPKILGKEIAELLRSGGFHDEAKDLEQQLLELGSSDPQHQAEARRAIESRCHPHWLGDLYIEGLSLTDWWNKLEDLSRSVK